MSGHCDHCRNRLSDTDCMTDCGHVICGSRCFRINEQRTDTCPICKKRCQYVVMGEEIPSDGKGFLTSPKVLLQNAETILEFQKRALTGVVKHQSYKIEKQKRLLHEVKAQLRQAKGYRWEIFHLQEENEYLRNCLGYPRMLQQ